MAETVIPILKRAVQLLEERGWTQHYSTFSLVNGGPLNIRTAIQLAQHELYPGQRDIQIAALHFLTLRLGGITNWESRRPRTHDEVMRKLTDLIKDLNDAHETGDGRVSHSRGFGKQPPGKLDTGSRPTAL